MSQNDNQAYLYNMVAQPAIQQQVIDAQHVDEELRVIGDRLATEAEHGEYKLGADRGIRVRNRLVVPKDSELRNKILIEAHYSKFSIHPGGTKMYRDLNRNFWWSGMKRDIAEYVSRCMTCQLVKTEHQKPAGQLQPLPIPEWKCEYVTMDFVSGLPKTLGDKSIVWVSNFLL